jgi:hypothetical protein
MEFRASGQLEKIIKDVAEKVQITDVDEFKSIFVQSYDLKKLLQ